MDTAAIRQTIASIRELRKQQDKSLRLLERACDLADMGIDPNEVSSLGWDDAYLSDRDRNILRSGFADTWLNQQRYPWLGYGRRLQFHNYATMKDGTKVPLSRPLPRV
jgi:hypothetical protein